MHAIPDFLLSAADQQRLNALLAPLSPEAPCGESARYDAVCMEIRLLREEDDPSLPMGQWERPLKRADWALIEQHCGEVLTARSKDVQIAAWLAEAWLRQRGFAGLYHGLRLVDALLRDYWPDVHPLIDDDGDADARLAPLEWLNESLSVSVRLHAPLLVLGGKLPPLTLADWERMTAQDVAPVPGERADAGAGEDAPLTRADIVFAAAQMGGELARVGAAVAHGLDCLDGMADFLDTRLGEQAPRLLKLRGVLETVQRVLLQLQDEQALDPAPDEAEAELAACAAPDGGDAMPAAAPAASPAPMAARWRNRTEAYATLEALAEYLAQIEPHSPTPFLIRRAVNWGRMPLPEVIAEIIREEGDLNRLVNVLGIRL
ncbi:type VI secretion system protein TssA [Janthinobacterium sp. SUN118]|uniref:type VI secretion system protein TssA n=1 Tax=Janthinobacterium sp. SUN118 TaxID=3004100 RepID=UPI0025B1B8F4|nr:type VI secretion system protein TssA [Janthinobacterium sp. SUN118]MDN2710539.1 type VI secretion system protein TssA [Janthinobacterium sp. SUN118]